MTSIFVWHVIGMAAALLTTFSFVPQILKVARTKSVHDVSIMMLSQFAAGVSLWCIYGIYLRNLIIILANIISLFSIIILISFYFKYRESGG